MALVEVKVPDIGDFKDVEIIELLVKPGDTVAKDQSLITVESDKASMEIPSSHAGVVKELKVKLGDKVGEGSLVLLLQADGAGVSAPAPVAAATSARASAAAPTPAPASAAATPAAGGGLVEIRVPDIGDFSDVAVIEVMVKPGDTVRTEQSLITVESDKASMEIPSSHAGVVRDVRIKLGDKVNQGSVIALVEATGAAPGAPAPSAAPSAAAASTAASAAASGRHMAPTASLPAIEPPAPKGQLPHASPTIRKLARELGVPLDELAGSGPKGRITQDDVNAFVKGVMSGTVQTKAQAGKAPAAAAPAGGGLPGLLAWPQVDFAKFGPIERVAMSRIKKLSGPNLHRNWVTIPHVTNHEDADITDLEAFRVQLNNENAKNKDAAKLTMLAFLIKACVATLKKFPDFNASIDASTGGDAIIRKNYWHIGFAADTPNGLVVPVIKDADQKGIFEIAAETSALAAKARDGKLAPADMQGGTFSISSLGGIGGTYFTPIINAPEVAILGVCRSTTKPVWDGKQFVPRLILPLSLSWDHRVVDGASAARFNAHLAALLADFRRAML
jgi:pyruvate dehydrogenase E2 component (dihydrolipoamide acetyltransferase)